MADGNLAQPFTNSVALTTNNTFVVAQPVNNLLRPAVVAKTGLLRGTFAHPQNPALPTKFAGAVLQDYNTAAGNFVGTNQAGSVLLIGD